MNRDRWYQGLNSGLMDWAAFPAAFFFFLFFCLLSFICFLSFVCFVSFLLFAFFLSFQGGSGLKHVILLPRPCKVLGLQACGTMPGWRDTFNRIAEDTFIFSFSFSKVVHPLGKRYPDHGLTCLRIADNRKAFNSTCLPWEEGGRKIKTCEGVKSHRFQGEVYPKTSLLSKFQMHPAFCWKYCCAHQRTSLGSCQT